MCANTLAAFNCMMSSMTWLACSDHEDELNKLINISSYVAITPLHIYFKLVEVYIIIQS